MKLKTKIIITLMLNTLFILGSLSLITCAAENKKVKSQKSTFITQKTAMSKVMKLDSKITRLIPCNTENTIKKVVDKYGKTFYMFLADYGTGENEITLEYLYLVDKKTGIVYTLQINGVPEQLTSRQITIPIL